MAQTATATQLQTEQLVTDVLATIEREREREIVARRFGLFDRKETLEQIGEMLGITRERVRQLEKSVVTRLRPRQSRAACLISPTFRPRSWNYCRTSGEVARVSELAAQLSRQSQPRRAGPGSFPESTVP